VDEVLSLIQTKKKTTLIKIRKDIFINLIDLAMIDEKSSQ